MTDYTGLDTGPFNADIPLVDLDTPVIGGLMGESNMATKKLADNDAYLYDIAKGFEKITVLDNTGISDVDINKDDIYRSLIELWVNEDNLFTGNLPEANELRPGTIACIKRTNGPAITSAKPIKLTAFSGESFYDAQVGIGSIYLYNEELVIMYATGSEDNPGWRIIARYGASSSGDLSSILNGGTYAANAIGITGYKDNDGFVSMIGAVDCLSTSGYTLITTDMPPGWYPLATATFSALKLHSGAISIITISMSTAGKISIPVPGDLPAVGDTIYLDNVKYRSR